MAQTHSMFMDTGDGVPRFVDVIETELSVVMRTQPMPVAVPTSIYADRPTGPHNSLTQTGEFEAPAIEYDQTTAVEILSAAQRHEVMQAVSAQVDDDLGIPDDDCPIFRSVLGRRDGTHSQTPDLCKVIVAFQLMRFCAWVQAQNARDWVDIRWRLDDVAIRVPAMDMLRRFAHTWDLWSPTVDDLSRGRFIMEVLP